MDRYPPSSSRRPRSDSQVDPADTSAASGSGSAARPAASHLHDPPTPAESDAPGSEYFGPLSTVASRPSLRSLRSRFSLASITNRPASAAGALDAPAAADPSRQPSIRIRRLSSTGSVASYAPSTPDTQTHNVGNVDTSHQRNRPRSASQPGPAPPPPTYVDAGTARARNTRRAMPQIALPRLTEEGSRPTMAELGMGGTSPMSPTMSMPTASAMERSHSDAEAGYDEETNKRQRRRTIVGRILRPGFRRSSVQPLATQAGPAPSDEYNEELVDWLDIIDPEVQTLSTLTNVQNSLFVPDLGSWINRRPAYVLSPPDTLGLPLREPLAVPEPPVIHEEPEAEARLGEGEEPDSAPYIRRTDTITSRLSDSHYAALPHGRTLEGWTPEEKWELDDRVRHMMHSRRARFKRQMKGFGKYVRRPLGFFVTLYATLITLFGLAWVLFLIGWIYVGEQQVYAIHVIDSVLVALFAIMGDGLAPFRAVDTYHMIFIAHYSKLIAKANKKKNKLQQTAGALGTSDANADNDVRRPQSLSTEKPTRKPSEASPGPHSSTADQKLIHQGDVDNHPVPAIALNGDRSKEQETDNGNHCPNDIFVEDGKSLNGEGDDDPLTPKQRKSFEHHQKKLSKSHSFYKPHETFTHNPFPLGHLIAIIILLDCHSCLQISLGACTWGIDYHHRPFALTTVILCVSITCNLTAGLVIMFGDRKTRKKDVVELLDRQALTGDAIKKVEKKREKEKENGSDGVLTGQSSRDGGE